MILLTGNKDKLREFEGILGIKINHKNVELDEIQSVNIEDVIRHKAKQAYDMLHEPVIVEDTGLYFEELNGLPGALTKFFLNKLSLEQICGLLKTNRNALARTAIAYFDGKAMEVFTGETKGKIAESPKGENGFGWDPVFIPEGYDKTFAELSPEEKQADFMRKTAIEKLKKFMEERL